MVERINNPDSPPPSYQILPTKEAKDDKSRREQEQESEESYKKEKPDDNWNKFSGRQQSVKFVTVPRERIGKVLFKRTFVRGGAYILEASVVWSDGRTTESALFIIRSPDDFIKIGKFSRGQLVTENFWAFGPQVQMGILERGTITGSWEVKDREEKQKLSSTGMMTSLLKSMGLINKMSGKVDWVILTIYVMAIMIAGTVIFYAIS